MTNAENTKYSYELSLKDKSYKNPRITLSDEDIKYILNHYVKGDKTFGANALARKFNVSQPTVLYIAKRKMKYLEVLNSGS